MELIAAVYEDWGIGADGTQPVTLSADRKFFREMTKGAAVVVGRRTVEDFPGQKPLPGRVNFLLTRSGQAPEGFILCESVEDLMEKIKNLPRVMVIGGGSIYRQLLPLCDRAYITKILTRVSSDTYLPNLDQEPQWQKIKTLQQGEEQGIFYEMCQYSRV